MRLIKTLTTLSLTILLMTMAAMAALADENAEEHSAYAIISISPQRVELHKKTMITARINLNGNDLPPNIQLSGDGADFEDIKPAENVDNSALSAITFYAKFSKLGKNEVTMRLGYEEPIAIKTFMINVTAPVAAPPPLPSPKDDTLPVPNKVGPTVIPPDTTPVILAALIDAIQNSIINKQETSLQSAPRIFRPNMVGQQKTPDSSLRIYDSLNVNEPGVLAVLTALKNQLDALNVSRDTNNPSIPKNTPDYARNPETLALLQQMLQSALNANALNRTSISVLFDRDAHTQEAFHPQTQQRNQVLNQAQLLESTRTAAEAERRAQWESMNTAKAEQAERSLTATELVRSQQSAQRSIEEQRQAAAQARQILANKPEKPLPARRDAPAKLVATVTPNLTQDDVTKRVRMDADTIIAASVERYLAFQLPCDRQTNRTSVGMCARSAKKPGRVLTSHPSMRPVLLWRPSKTGKGKNRRAWRPVKSLPAKKYPVGLHKKSGTIRARIGLNSSPNILETLNGIEFAIAEVKHDQLKRAGHAMVTAWPKRPLLRTGVIASCPLQATGGCVYRVNATSNFRQVKGRVASGTVRLRAGQVRQLNVPLSIRGRWRYAAKVKKARVTVRSTARYGKRVERKVRNTPITIKYVKTKVKTKTKTKVKQ